MAGENSRRVIAGLTQIGVPYMFAFMMMTALRFIPEFGAVFADALVSIQLRGVELKKVPLGRKLRLYGYLLLPVTADAVVKSQDLAIAMEARGFGAQKKADKLPAPENGKERLDSSGCDCYNNVGYHIFDRTLSIIPG